MSEMVKMISSKNNQHIKMAKSLLNRKYREKHQLFVLEGVRLIEEAAAAGIKIKFALYCSKLCHSTRGAKLLDQFSRLRVSTIEVEDHILEDLADTENPQGIVVVAKMTNSILSDINLGKDGMLLLIDGVQDPGNLGTMIRTACAAGVSGVILSQGTVDVFNPKAVRASMGTLFHIPVIRMADNQIILNYLKENRYRIIVADVTGEKLYYDADVRGPVALENFFLLMQMKL